MVPQPTSQQRGEPPPNGLHTGPGQPMRLRQPSLPAPDPSGQPAAPPAALPAPIAACLAACSAPARTVPATPPLPRQGESTPLRTRPGQGQARARGKSAMAAETSCSGSPCRISAETDSEDGEDMNVDETNGTPADPENDREWTSVHRRKAAKRGHASDSDDSTATVRTNPEAPTQPKTTRIPPIIIEGIKNWQGFLRNLKHSGYTFEASFIGDSIRIKCDTPGHFREIQTYLKQQGIGFHTFQLRSEREIKVALRGLRHDTPTNDIIEDLQYEGFTPTSATLLSRTENGVKLPANTFLIRLRKTGSWGKIWELRSLLGVSVKVEEFHPKPGLPQCYRCQRYGHSSLNCNLPVKCVKCAGDHFGRECQISDTDQPTCSNCSGHHVASWRGCPAHKAELARRKGKSQPQKTVTRSRSRPSTLTATQHNQAAANRPHEAQPVPAASAFPPLTTPTVGPQGASDESPSHSTTQHPPSSFAAVLRRSRSQASKKRRIRRPARQHSEHTATEADSESEHVQLEDTDDVPSDAEDPAFTKTNHVRRRPHPVAPPPANPSGTFHPKAPEAISVESLLRWMSHIIPLLLSPDKKSPAEVLAAVLQSLQTLINHGQTD